MAGLEPGSDGACQLAEPNPDSLSNSAVARGEHGTGSVSSGKEPLQANL